MYDELFSLRPVFTMIGVVLFTILKQCLSKSTHAVVRIRRLVTELTTRTID